MGPGGSWGQQGDHSGEGVVFWSLCYPSVNRCRMLLNVNCGSNKIDKKYYFFIQVSDSTVN